MRCVTKENTIDRASLELVQLLPFLKNEAFTTKDMEVTHLKCVTVHQLVIGFLLVNLEVDPVRHMARNIDRLIEHRPSHLAQGPNFPFHYAILGSVYGLENWCSRPKSWKKVLK
jgi:hypothetical protein